MEGGLNITLVVGTAKTGHAPSLEIPGMYPHLKAQALSSTIRSPNPKLQTPNPKP